MNFQNVLDYDEEKPEASVVKEETKKKVVGIPTKRQVKGRGCEFCPLNKVPGIRKVKNLDKITGKKIMVWAQNPGQLENQKGKELIGPAGSLLWEEGAKVGLKREDCDIQNVVRCLTADKNELDQLIPREPKKLELFCCSIYNEEAIERTQGNTVVHLVLGKVAAKALLKGEFRKDQKILYSDKLNAWVVVNYHPSYFLRGAPRSKLKEFRDALAITVKKAKQGKGKFAYIESQDYKAVPAKSLKEELLRPILAAAKKGIRVAVDIEDGKNDKGEDVIICIGFSWEPGKSRIVFLSHPEVLHSKEHQAMKFKAVKWLLENKEIKKAFQNGQYDVRKLQAKAGILVKGFDHDTIYSEYLRFSWRRAFGLEATADMRFKDFAGYKDIAKPYRDEKGIPNYWRMPKKEMVLYNGADCDLTKRIEQSNSGKAPQQLLKVFMWASFTLATMEELGPWFDKEHDKLLVDWIPKRIERLKGQLKEISGDDKFKPSSPVQVAKVVYDKLKLGRYLDKEWIRDHDRSTDKETMQLLGQFHKFPNLMIQYRKLEKKKSTYLDGYRASAELNGGRLRTKWWLTGTISGRLRSGGEKKSAKAKEKKGLVNLQNIHGDQDIENLLVSDLRWREVYNEWRKKKSS